MKKTKLSPMMEQYLQTKEKYKDCIIFYRLGDFYEMFFDDAIKASKMLDLTLTGRDCGLEERAPMCGVPYHAADEYIAKLVSLGEKVAVCEQLTEPTKGKDLVQRDVVRIVTAGTVTNDELIDKKNNNFLGSVYIEEKGCSFAWVDITTGEFFAKEWREQNFLSEISNELIKISPAEIIANKRGYEVFSASPLIEHGLLPKFNLFIESEFNNQIALDTIKSQLKLQSLSSLGLQDNSLNICSSGALISYLKETQKHALLNINKISVQNPQNYVMLDANATRNLELTKTLHDGKKYGSLLWLLDKTKTSMGARKLNNWILFPLSDKDKIEERLDAVESLYNSTLIRQSLSDLLSEIKDISRLAGKISNGNLMPADCVALKKSLEILPNVKFQLLGINSTLIQQICYDIEDFSEIVELLNSAISDNPPPTTKDGGYIKDGYSNELDELRSISKNSKFYLSELENREREKTGIKNLRVAYNRIFGYYIEVTNSFKDRVPYEYVRRQTLANAERFITDELKDLESKILSSEEQSLKLETKIYNYVKQFLSDRIESLLTSAEAIANLDVITSLATVARQNNYVKPTILDNNGTLNVVDGRHPVVENVSRQKFVPNDCLLDNRDNRMMIITGPNMAGKSTYMRQVALITLMAHVGSFVPAKSAEIPLTDKIFTRVGASDNLISDQSTFMVEMSEMADILNNATKKSLIILDEIGRGTSTYDGLSIAWAVVEYITKKIKAKTLFATHYHELTELEGILEGVKNYKVTVKEMQNTIVFFRKIMRGGTNKSFGIEVAELAGINKEVTQKAKNILKSLEKKDIARSNFTPSISEEKEVQPVEVEKILLDLDINNTSPMQSFNILSDLIEKVKNKYE